MIGSGPGGYVASIKAAQLGMKVKAKDQYILSKENVIKIIKC